MNHTRPHTSSCTHRHSSTLTRLTPACKASPASLSNIPHTINASLRSSSSISILSKNHASSSNATNHLHSSSSSSNGSIPRASRSASSSTSALSYTQHALHPHPSPRSSTATSATSRKKAKGPALTPPKSDLPPTPAPEEPAALTTKQKAYLAQFPPRSPRWLDWAATLATVPHLTPAAAESILYAQPLLLTKPHAGVAAHLASIAALLGGAADVGGAGLAALLRSAPLLATYKPDRVAAALAWLTPALNLQPEEVRRVVGEQPALLAFGVDALQERLRAYLDLGVSLDDLRAAILAHPFLLSLAPRATAECLAYLCEAFHCSALQVLQGSPGLLNVNVERHRARAGFLGVLQAPDVGLHSLMAGAGDASFAAVHIRAYQLRTGRSLPQLCELLRGRGHWLRDSLDAAQNAGQLSKLKCFQIWITWERQRQSLS
ncbi:MAG: hypothetical protein WDW38_010444 [Sanguina aurantia]